MASRSAVSGTRYRTIALIICCTLAAAGFACPRLISSAASHEPQRRASTQRRRPPNVSHTRVDYTRFTHRTHTEQQKLACDACHKFPSANWKDVRKGDEAFPDITEYPAHESCLNCHRQQFFARERPAPAICAVCHVANSPRNTTRFPFPSLGTTFLNSPRGQDFASDFAVFFPHDKHIEIVGRLTPPHVFDRGVSFVAVSFAQQKKEEKKAEESPDKSCVVCHQTYLPQGTSEQEYVTAPPKDLHDGFWLKKGTFKTVPDSHATCFTCHSPDNTDLKPGPADCATCHRLAPGAFTARVDFDPQVPSAEGITDRRLLAAWRKRDSSATFRHEGGMHPDLSCMDCHKVTALDTTDARTKKIPVLSCGGGAGCHVTPTVDDGGVLNIEFDGRKGDATFRCAKCHLVYGREPLPASHTKALEAFKQK
jgi:hypothetical protein